MRTTLIFSLLISAFLANGQRQIIDQYVLMSDHDSLATNIFLPAQEGKYPVVLMRTPYDKSQRQFGEYFNKHGYIFIVQDVRGRVKSSGQFKDWSDEALDGLETINWITQQEWSNGQVGLIGSSYSGYAAMQLAGTNHPAIKAIVNNSGPANLYDVVFPGGVFHNTALLPWTTAFTNNRGFNFPPYSSGLSMNELVRQKPLNNAFVKNNYQGVFWDYIVNHQTEDYYWDQLNANNLALSNVPVLHITSWFDFIGTSAIDAYQKMVQGQQERTKQTNQEMIIGPWIHDDMINGRTKVGEIDFGEDVKFGLNKFLELAIDYYDFHMKGVTNEARVPFKFFDLGTREWIEATAWPETTQQVFYLSASDNEKSLSKTPSLGNKKDSFIFDPSSPVETLGGANIHFPFFGETNGIQTQNVMEDQQGLLVYTTEALNEELNIFGKIKAKLYVSTNAEDADFTVKLNLIDAQGNVTNIRDGIQRLSLSKNRAQRNFVSPGEIVEVEIDMGYVAIVIPKGNQLSIQVSSSNYPKFSLNPGTQENPLMTSEFKKASQTIYMSSTQRSRIELPIRK